VLNAAARLVYSRRTSEHTTPLSRELHWLRVPERIQFRLCVLAYHCVHGTATAYLSDSLRPTSEIVARRCLRSADTTTLQVPSTRRATLGDRPRLSGGCSACMEQSATKDSGLLLTFDIPEGDQVSLFSSVIWLTWRRLLQWSADVCIELCNSLNSDYCKVPPQLCDWQHSIPLIHDICSSSNSTRKIRYQIECQTRQKPVFWYRFSASISGAIVYQWHYDELKVASRDIALGVISYQRHLRSSKSVPIESQCGSFY